MSGAEVVGLVSGIIAIVDAVFKIYDAAQETSGLPGSFRDVVRRMPVVKDTMLAVKCDLQDSGHDESLAALTEVLESCKEKVEKLEKIYRRVVLGPQASKAERYVSAVRNVGKGRRVEDLMESVLADVQLLTANYAIKAATKRKIQDILDKTENGTDPREDVGYSARGHELSKATIENYGLGSQNVHVGNGNQNVNTGSGGQFSGHFQGPFNFGISTSK